MLIVVPGGLSASGENDCVTALFAAALALAAVTAAFWAVTPDSLVELFAEANRGSCVAAVDDAE
ncbi:hypothetical protein PICSAR26_04077 [Mycobacterium avium subsp. paratuberculosis]|nr:hypothetical protein PICSAR26_04077 [Mycobacterium avium subsp. paratuberculosis]